jgi:peptidyl-prolyl cis-trans isomerase D
MLQLFRNFFKSKLGVGITLAFLVLIALAFGSSDVVSNGAFGGIAGGDRVAVVGDTRVDASDLSTAVTNALEQTRQQNPTLSMQAFLANDGIENVLDQLIRRTALAEFAREHGMRAGDRLVGSELAQIPAFQGPGGNFDENAFKAVLQQRNLTEAAVREDVAMGLLARQVLTPIAFSPVMPASFARQYSALLRERRNGTIALLPSSAFAPQGDPTAAQLQAYYSANSKLFIRPERRVIRYATFGPEAIGTLPAPTEAQIAQRYQRDAAQYAAVERRRFTQLIVPTQDAARAIEAEVRGGKSLDAAAREKGLATASVGPVSRKDFTTSASAAVAQAAFAAAQGALTAPAHGTLGWYVLRVDAIDRQPARTLAQVRGAISTALAEEQRRAAFADLAARVEEELDNGGNLTDVAKELKVTLASTRPATADGRIYGVQGETVPPILGRVLETAFEMEENEPQLAEVVPGQTNVIFDVSDITPSATAPLAEIRSDVILAWRRDEGAKAAKAAADRVVQRLARGTPLSAALAAEGRPVPPPQPVSLSREELGRQGRVPPSLALFFSMAQGTVKRLEAAGHGGWYVLQLDRIEPGAIAANDPIIAATMRQLGQASGEEYLEEFVNAAQREIGVERNEAAIKAVAAQLTGQNNN